MKKTLQEFREFALRGNVVELAVAVIIGASFGKIVSSMVDDIVSPAILQPIMNAAHAENLNDLVIPNTGIRYGNFLSNVLNFFLIIASLFFIIKGITRFQKKNTAPAPPQNPSRQEILLEEIRDILKSKS